MGIIDSGPYQNWMSAFDRHDQMQRRYRAAVSTGNSELVEYIGRQLGSAARELEQALGALNG